MYNPYTQIWGFPRGVSVKKFIIGILALLGVAAMAQYQVPTVVPTVTIASSPKTGLPASVVGSLGWHGFGYENGQLVDNPWFGKTKKVDMGEQVLTLVYNCSTLIAGTQHVPMVNVVTALSPSHLWETDFHRLVAIYGGLSNNLADKDIVTKLDLFMAASTYIGQHQEEMCALAAKKSLKEMLASPSLSFAVDLSDMTRFDKASPFDLKVQTVKVVLPEELLRALALKAIETPKVMRQNAAVPQQKCCQCVPMVCTQKVP